MYPILGFSLTKIEAGMIVFDWIVHICHQSYAKEAEPCTTSSYATEAEPCTTSCKHDYLHHEPEIPTGKVP